MNPIIPPLELDPSHANTCAAAGVALLDIRAEGERALGMALTAQGVSSDALLKSPEVWLADRAAPAMLICASGRRSLAAAEALRARGYTSVCSVAGGTQAWQAAGLPMTVPSEPAEFLDRYARHLSLAQVGLVGQQRLRAARVVVVGAGGLGSPTALYLAAAGVGQLSVIDNDVVERSNLQRQVLHREADIGRPKVASAQATLNALNPSIAIQPIRARLAADNVDALLAGHDLVIDGSDNFPTRYLVNDACLRLGLPLVYGAVERFAGQVAVFWPSRNEARGSCYRCLFPESPDPRFAPNCAEAGVLGVLPGIVGSLQAAEALKILLGIGEPLVDTLLRIDALSMRFDRVRLSRDPECASCGLPASP